MKTMLTLLCTLALPALAQTTTTVQTQPSQPAPSTTTVQTQPSQPASPSTQVVVNPNDTPPPPPPSSRVQVDTGAAPTTSVEAVPNGRSSAVIIATDALYGGFTGTLIGGAVTLIDQGNNWQRDLMVGAGVGILAGAAFGVYEAATQPPTRVVTHAAADRDGASSDSDGVTLMAAGGRF